MPASCGLRAPERFCPRCFDPLLRCFPCASLVIFLGCLSLSPSVKYKSVTGRENLLDRSRRSDHLNCLKVFLQGRRSAWAGSRPPRTSAHGRTPGLLLGSAGRSAHRVSPTGVPHLCAQTAWMPVDVPWPGGCRRRLLGPSAVSRLGVFP